MNITFHHTHDLSGDSTNHFKIIHLISSKNSILINVKKIEKIYMDSEKFEFRTRIGHLIIIDGTLFLYNLEITFRHCYYYYTKWTFLTLIWLTFRIFFYIAKYSNSD